MRRVRQVRMIRTDNKDFSYFSGHELQWGGLRGPIDGGSQQYGNVTLLAVIALATDNLNSATAQAVNAVVKRKLPHGTGNRPLGGGRRSAARARA